MGTEKWRREAVNNNHADIQHIKGPGSTYSIFLGENLLSDVGSHLKKIRFSGRCALVTNPTIRKHYAESVLQSLTRHGLRPVLCEIPDGEQFKTLQTVAELYEQFLAAGLERKSPVLALGGGVLGDAAGFAAATFLRGIPFVQIPTTLLAMVDASIGGKTGVDLPQGKNLVGAFKQPEMVFIDPAVLSTLPAVEFRSGLAEVVKNSIIGSPSLFEALKRGEFTLPWMLAEAIQVKIRVVEADPFEQGRRAVLNLGHTFAHAFEQLSNYELRHGQAVSIGIACAARLAQNLNHCSAPDAEAIIDLLEFLDMPTQIPNHSPDAVWA
ncbi:MAG: 3-dehydroquinate synthase, partial [Anaerolineae bacterium]